MTLIGQVKIILVEPAGERNIGSIARVMRNMGLSDLVIVKPRCDYLSEDAQVMAVHGVEVLQKAVIVDSLPMALEGCQRAIATTARTRGIPTILETPRQALPWLIEKNVTSALIFGPEDRGLSNQELSYAQRFVCIKANPEYPSLNLAQAVGICAYELYQNLNDLNISDNSDNEMNANIEELEGYYQHLESVLLDVNYLYPHTAAVKMEKLRRIINRTNLKSQELAMIRGILRQIQWAIKDR
ncbi:RNA methyltransferase [Geminocystis sp. NIES-3708]|uniref:RNA methyltransferase n=1 Tax=Geminocystis sp. NIES-3708 TaxID=1615909 RepID=UPI00083720AF|nr:RNA methyltransferase [Geminocystis sp. NIES-3708]